MALTKKERTDVLINCDAKSCDRIISFVQQEIGEKGENLPEAFWRLITFQLADGNQWVFCSKSCLLEHLNDYVPLKSPKLKREEDEASIKTAQANAIKGKLIYTPERPEVEPNPTVVPESNVIPFSVPVPSLENPVEESEPLPEVS